MIYTLSAEPPGVGVGRFFQSHGYQFYVRLIMRQKNALKVNEGGFNTVPVDSYSPNDYGLYNMAGNVAEWTSTAYDESVYDFDHDLNPEYSYDAMANDPPALKRKVIRGGSWKDIGYFLQTSSRSYEYQDTAKCYIGFRSVMTYLCRGKAVSAEDL